MSVSHKRFEQLGIALGTGHDLEGYRAMTTNKVIQQIKRDNANIVQVTVYMKQIGRHGFKNRKHTDDETFQLVLRKVRSFKLAIFVKPVIEPETKTGKFIWRGFIPGTDRWFDEVHTPFILRIAKIAQMEKVEMLSIGSEYVRTLWNTAKWVETIRLVREVYNGKLTYIANHDVSENNLF